MPADFAERQRSLPPAFRAFVPELLGPEFPAELRTVSELWFRCGYAPGIAAYLNFFLLHDLVVRHDDADARRFATWKTMAKSFYETDLFIRAVTDSGREATGGISSPRVRALLQQIMLRHERRAIPSWMMTYFGWSLFEAVEAQCGPLDAERQRLHLAYMSKAWRLMGVPFGTDRAQMVAFARDVEAHHARLAPQTLRHARAILRIGELIGVPSAPQRLLPLLPPETRALFAPYADAVRPFWLRRVACRVLGRLLVPRAVGKPRVAVPFVPAA